VVDELFKRYRPVDIISRVEMRTRLNNVHTLQHTVAIVAAICRSFPLSLLLSSANKTPISCMTAAFHDDGLLNLIEAAMTAKWPSGLAYKVVDELFKRYRPVDIISRVEMRTRLNNVHMKANDDPRILFDQLTSIQNAYNDATRKIDPDDLTAVVLEKAPDGYKSLLTAEQRNKGNNLNFEDLRSCMNDLYRTLHSNEVAKPNEDEHEVSLFAPASNVQNICGYCNKCGHQEDECRKKKAEKSQNNTLNTLRPCRHCGGKHLDYKCWKLPENSGRRPNNWTSRRTETANMAHDGRYGPNIELLLRNMDEDIKAIPLDQDLLLHPDIWIGDSAATVHMSPRATGMVNIKKSEGKITVGYGAVMMIKQTGDVPCEICNKEGQALQTAKVTDVTLTQGSPFNLFSLTKLMQQGWSLGGDKNVGITLSKGATN
jgi:hypothetical protein